MMWPGSKIKFESIELPLDLETMSKSIGSKIETVESLLESVRHDVISIFLATTRVEVKLGVVRL